MLVLYIPVSHSPKPISHFEKCPRFTNLFHVSILVLVAPEQARNVMEVNMPADLSAERIQPVTLPMNTRDIVEANLV